MLLMPESLAFFSQAAPLSESRLTIIRTVTPWLIIESQSEANLVDVLGGVLDDRGVASRRDRLLQEPAGRCSPSAARSPRPAGSRRPWPWLRACCCCRCPASPPLLPPQAVSTRGRIATPATAIIRIRIAWCLSDRERRHRISGRQECCGPQRTHPLTTPGSHKFVTAAKRPTRPVNVSLSCEDRCRTTATRAPADRSRAPGS